MLYIIPPPVPTAKIFENLMTRLRWIGDSLKDATKEEGAYFLQSNNIQGLLIQANGWSIDTRTSSFANSLAAGIKSTLSNIFSSYTGGRVTMDKLDQLSPKTLSDQQVPKDAIKAIQISNGQIKSIDLINGVPVTPQPTSSTPDAAINDKSTTNRIVLWSLVGLALTSLALVIVSSLKKENLKSP